MVQQLNRSSLEALRIGQATDELYRIRSTPPEISVGLDFETTGLNPRKHKMVLVQLKPKGKKVLLIDVRDEDRGALHSALLPLVTDSRRTFVGQNLLFELHWLLTYLGFEVDDLRATFSDTMLRELVILGLGYGDAKKRGLAVNMHDIAERYGLSVHKEEQIWWINLDKPRLFYADGSYSFKTDRVTAWFHRDHTAYGPDESREAENAFVRESAEQWSQEFPQKMLEYGRQDVSVVHLISAKQQELIDEYGLQEVVDLEARVLPAVAGMQHYGMSINREKWLEIIAGIDAHAEELAAGLHTYVDVAVLEHRRQAWVEKAQPYQQWVQDRDAMVARAKESWELNALEPVVASPLPLIPGAEEKKPHKPKIRKDYTGPSWKNAKQATIELFEQQNPKPKAPQALKDGVNLNSSDQMQVALRSRGHNINSTKEDVLTPLAESDPVIQLLLDYRDFNTARTKYGPAYLEEHAPDNTIYASIQQIGAETGRFSVREPNIQQVPARGAGEHLREAIVSRKGYAFIDFDFSNVELRGAANVSGDPVMLAAFESGEDLHAKTAEVMFDLLRNPDYVAAEDKKEWTDSHNAVVGGRELNGTTYRSVAKTINFGLLYGMGANKLASKLRITVDAAKVLMRLYRETYKVAVKWLRDQGQRIERPDKDGRVYSVTLAGRRRWFTLPKLEVDKNVSNAAWQEALDKHNKHLAAIQRALANHPIQGTSAEVTKLSTALWQERYNCNDMRLVCVVHDELLIECKDDPETIALARARLEEVMLEGFQHFFKRVNPGKIGGKPASYYWNH